MYSNLFTIKELSSVRQWYRLVIRRLKPRRTDTVRVARQSLHGSSTTWFQTPCCHPKLKSDLIRSIKTDTVVERRLKQAFSNFLYVPSGGCFQLPKWLIMNLILNLWEESSLKKERKKERQQEMQSDKEDKEMLQSSTNHTITETSRLANSTCSPRILHARVVSRGILEFLFLEKPFRL